MYETVARYSSYWRAGFVTKANKQTQKRKRDGKKKQSNGRNETETVETKHQTKENEKLLKNVGFMARLIAPVEGRFER